MTNAIDQHGYDVPHKVRVISWVTVAVMIVGVCLAGAAAIMPGTGVAHSTQWAVGLLIAGAVVFVIGGIGAMVSGVMNEFH